MFLRWGTLCKGKGTDVGGVEDESWEFGRPRILLMIIIRLVKEGSDQAMVRFKKEGMEYIVNIEVWGQL
jgi:hypothetical protein